MIKNQLFKANKKLFNTKEQLNSQILKKLLPNYEQQNSIIKKFQLNILLVLEEEDTYEDDLFYQAVNDLIRKYNSNLNLYIIDNFYTDSENDDNVYSYGPQYTYRSYMRNAFFNLDVQNDENLKISLKSIRSSKQLKLTDLQQNYQAVVIRKLNAFYTNILSVSLGQTFILLDMTLEQLKELKIAPSTNEIFILNSFLYDQAYNKANTNFFLSEFLNFVKDSYENYLGNELYSCFTQVTDEPESTDGTNKAKSDDNENFDLNK